MAYSKQMESILSVGLNTVSPWDALGPGEARQMKNFRLDEPGALVARLGYSVVRATLRAHSLFYGVTKFFAGVGASLYAGANFDAVIASGFDGLKLWFASFQDQVWVMNRAKQVRTDGVTSAPMSIAAPTTQPDAVVTPGGPLTGTYYYYVTFGDAAGYESNPSPISVSVFPVGASVNLSAIQVSAEPNVVKRRIYRGGGTQDAILFISDIPDNVTTTFTDNVDELTALDLDEELFLDNDVAPAARGVVGPYFGKLIAWSTVEHPARMYWTPTARPAAWPGANDNAAGNWVDCGSGDDEILIITNHNRYLVIYKQRSIWRLIGDPDTNDPELIDTNRGVTSQDGAVNAGGVDYFSGLEGLYTFNGDVVESVSAKVENVVEEGHLAYIDETNVRPRIGDYSTIACGLFDDTVYISFMNTDGVRDCYKFNSGQNAWAREASSMGGLISFCYVALPGTRMLAGLDAGGIVSIEQRFDGDGGTPIALSYQSGYFDQGNPNSIKRYGEIAIEFRIPPPSTLTIEALFDGGKTVLQLGTISSATTQWNHFALGRNASNLPDGEGVKAHNISIRISGAAVTQPIAIHKIVLFYYGEARTAKSFDSGVIDLGTQSDKSVQRFEVGYECGAALNWDVWTDLPGNVLASREVGAIPVTAGRHVETIVLTPRDGRFLRFMGWSTGPFQLHHLRVEKLDMAFYVDATRSYRTDFINSDDYVVAQLRDLELDYSSTAPIIATLFTDLPGGVLAARRTITFPARPTFGTERLQFDDAAHNFQTVDAKTFYVLFECPAGVGRVLGGAIGGRPFNGIYIDGATTPQGNYQSPVFAL